MAPSCRPVGLNSHTLRAPGISAKIGPNPISRKQANKSTLERSNALVGIFFSWQIVIGKYFIGSKRVLQKNPPSHECMVCMQVVYTYMSWFGSSPFHVIEWNDHGGYSSQSALARKKHNPE